MRQKGITDPLDVWCLFFLESSLPTIPWMALITFPVGEGAAFSSSPPWGEDKAGRVEPRKDSVFPLHPAIKLACWTGLLPLSTMQCPPSFPHSVLLPVEAPLPQVWSLLPLHPVAFLLLTWNLG